MHTLSIEENSRSFRKLAILAFGYCLAALVSIGIYQFGHGEAGLWVPNAFAVAFLLRNRPIKAWQSSLAVICGGGAASLMTGCTPTTTLLFALANTGEVVLAMLLLARWRGAEAGRIDTVAAYIGTAALAGGLAPAIIATAFSVFTGLVLNWPMLETLSAWCAGDALGYALFFPVLLLASTATLKASWQGRRPRHLAIAAIGCVLFTIGAVEWTRYPFVLTMVPLLLAGTRFPPFPLAVIAALVGSTVLGMELAHLVPGLDLSVSQAGFQVSIAVTAVVPVLVGMLLDEMRRDRRRILESEQRFRRAMEDSAIGMALVSLDAKIMQANRAFADMLGYTQAELQQRTFFEITYPQDMTIGRETVRRALAGEADAYRFEKRYLRKDGSPMWAQLAGSVIRDQETKKPLYLVSQIEDIDSRKRGEAALIEAESRWSFALETAGQGVWDFDRRRERTYYSPLWKRILGYGPDELSDEQNMWLDLIHPDDRPTALAADEACKSGKSSDYDAEFRMRHKDGRWIWVHDRGKILERDADGTAIRAIGTHTDITRQKQVEESVAAAAQALADEKERLRITLHSIADAVICTDAANRVAFMNPAAESLTGFDIVAAYGEPLESVFCPIDEESGQNIIRSSGPGGSLNWSHETGRAVLVRPDRTRRSIREMISPILTAKDDFAGSAIVFQDVTDARAMQRDLAYAATHDALTGLANRSGFVRSLLALLGTVATEGSQHALLFIDLDRFKAVNDTAGHLAGDALLKKVAGTIKSKVRSNDLVARFGGDEFAVLLRSCSLEGARRIAEAIVAAVCTLDFTWEGQPHQVGASIGAAPITAASGELDEVVAQADEACYAAKAAGRGCVRVYGMNPDDSPVMPTRLAG